MASKTGKSAYEQVAADLRAQITDGDLATGDQIPSEAELMTHYGVSRIVVRMAVDRLQSEGLVVKRQGVGTFVREQAPPSKRIAGDLYGVRPKGSPVKAAAARAGQQAEWEYSSRATIATRAVAERLAIEPGAEVMRTTYTFFADDKPIKLSTSYEPLDLTRGTPIEQPEASPVSGVVPRFDLIGQHITHVTEDVVARAARPHEVEQLEVAPGVPVFVITRTYFVGNQPVETCDIITAADRYALSYTIPLPPFSEEDGEA
ncbi:GntR family transcriptional regulator [Streptomyces sp. NPDC053493]|uniref:GntR family transcriptional regulator n=1 Tax=Streptomyces sp. NPDC053493 TaxID=3365705 RepID=UPI0037D4449F